MHVALLCVVPDGTAPTDGTLTRVALPTTVQWPVGDSGTVTFSAIGEDGSVYDLDGCAVTLVCRKLVADATPVFAYEATIDPTPEGGTAPGTGEFPVVGTDTEDMTPGLAYWFDVRLVDADDAVFHILPPSKWLPTMTIARADEPPEPEPAPAP